MLIYFNPDKSIFSEDIGSLACHNRLFNAWRLHGVLAYVGEYKSSGVGDLIKQAPNRVRTLWEKKCKELKRLSSGVNSTEGEIGSNFPDYFGACKKYAVILGEEGWESRGFCSSNNVEVVSENKYFQRFCAVDIDGPFHAASAAKARQITKDLPRDAVWQIWFADYVAIERHVKVYDQWCLKAYLESRCRFNSGLGFLLKKIAETNFHGRRTIEIYTTAEWGPSNRQKVSEEIAAEFQSFANADLVGGSIGYIKVYFCLPGSWKQRMHQRYIRLGDRYWIRADWGLEPFQLERKEPHSSLVVGCYADEQARAEEKRLREQIVFQEILVPVG